MNVVTFFGYVSVILDSFHCLRILNYDIFTYFCELLPPENNNINYCLKQLFFTNEFCKLMSMLEFLCFKFWALVFQVFNIEFLFVFSFTINLVISKLEILMNKIQRTRNIEILSKIKLKTFVQFRVGRHGSSIWNLNIWLLAISCALSFPNYCFVSVRIIFSRTGEVWFHRM